jgi:transposase
VVVPRYGGVKWLKKVSMTKAQVTIPLDIPEVQALKSEINKAGELTITVESTKETTVCRRCGRIVQKFHGYDDWGKPRYLPMLSTLSAKTIPL